MVLCMLELRFNAEKMEIFVVAVTGPGRISNRPRLPHENWKNLDG